MRKLILAIVIFAILAGIGGYVWVDYNQAQTALTRAKLEVQTVGEILHRQQNVTRAREVSQLAKIKVDALRKLHSTWLRSTDIDALEKELAGYNEEIDKQPSKP